MILKSDQIARELEKPVNPDDPLIISPEPDLAKLRKSGAASVDVRLARVSYLQAHNPQIYRQTC